MRIRLIGMLIISIIVMGCTDEISFDTLNIGRFLADIPDECQPVSEIHDCIVDIQTSSDLKRNEYLSEMTDMDSGYGTLCVPDVEDAVISVYTRDSVSTKARVKQMEILVDSGEITSLRIWKNEQLICEVDGRMGMDILNGDYFFLSGTQKIYKGHMTSIERSSDYTDACEKFVETEKRYFYEGDIPYYQLVEREYRNWLYELNAPLGEINYRRIEDMDINVSVSAEFTVRRIEYGEAYGRDLSPWQVLFLENPPYVIFKTSIDAGKEVVYMALFDKSRYEKCGVFFSYDHHLFTLRMGHAFNCDVMHEDFKIRYINEYESLGSSGVFNLSLDSLSNAIITGTDKNNRSVSMGEYNVPYDEDLYEILWQRLQQEEQVAIERYQRKKEYEERAKAIIERMVTVPCPECNGLGGTGQTGMGVVHGSLNCPCCHGRGYLEIDPYSAADAELYKDLLRH